MGAPDRGCISASPLPGGHAAEIVLAERGETTATDATEYLARQQMLCPALVPPMPLWSAFCQACRGRFGSKASLDPAPLIIVDDLQMRHRGRDNRVWPAVAPNRLPGIRVLYGVLAIPDQSAIIGLIAEQAISTQRPASDGSVIPDPPTRSGNAFLVQLLGDLARACSAGIGFKDTLHDGDPRLVERADTPVDLAGLRQLPNRHIAIGRQTNAATLTDAALQAPPRLVG